MIVVFLTILAVCLTITFLWAKDKKKRMQQAAETPPIDGIPLAPNAHCLFGHMGELNKGGFRAGQRRVLVESADDDGVCSFWFLNKAAVSVLLGKDVKAVLNASSYREPIGFLKIHNDVFLGPYALTALMGKEWKYYRMVVHRSFTPAALKGSQKAINAVASTLANSLLRAVKSSPDGSYQAAVLPIMKMATIDVFASSALGVDLQCCAKLQPSPIAQAFDFLTDEYTRRLSRPWDPSSRLYWLPTTANRRHSQERNRIRSFIAELIAKKRGEIFLAKESSESNVSSVQANDLLTSLLKANADKGGEMSDNVLADTLMVLLFGGYDTTSITLAYALYLLATHADVQEQCLSEIQSVLGNGAASLDDPADLPYTRAIILETLRLYPAAPATTRNLEKPLELHGKVVPGGTMIYIPIWSIQRDPRNYPKPDEFRPDRWVRKTSDGIWIERFPDENEGPIQAMPSANRDAFCAFSGGARNCVGRVLAMQEAVTLLAFLVRDLKFECLPDYKLEPRLSSFIQKPADDLPMSILARRDGNM